MSGRPKNDVEKAIAELKEATKDLTGCQDHYFKNDLFLLRHLKAARMDLKKAEKLLRDNWTWRKNNNAAELNKDDFHPDMKEGFQNHRMRMKDGRPVLAACVSCVDFKGLIAKHGRATMSQYVASHLLDMEKECMAINEARLKPEVGENNNEVEESKGSDGTAKVGEITEDFFEGCVYFVDMKDLPWKQIISFSNIAFAYDVASDYTKFGVGQGSYFVAVNCPSAALKMAFILKKIIEGPNFNVEVYGTNMDEWKSVFLKQVDADVLPTNFGGNRVVPCLAQTL